MTEAADLDRMFDAAPFGVVHLDEHMRFVWTNRSFALLTGDTADELRGRDVHEVYPDLDPALVRALSAVLAGDQPAAEHLVRRRREGSPSNALAFQVVVFPVTGADGRPGVGAIVKEATTEVEANARLAMATERLHLLSELGRQMSTTLDTDRIVELTADLLLPVLGDACAVDLVEDDDPLFRQVTRASATHGGDRSATATEIAPPPPVSQVLKSGRLLRYPVVPAGLIDDIDTERTGSALVVPMRARGQTVGAVSLARFGASRGYEPDDVAFAVEAAGRMGVALDNARLFARQRDAAMAMQHALLPQRLPTLPGVELAARYIAGSADTEVGGDWFDVIPLPDSSLAVVIGDVMGRGVRAAAVMGQLRAAVRAYALLDLAPSRLLLYLDRVVSLLDDVQLVTCLYGVLDPDTGAFRYAKAGHHPPLMRRADRSVAVLDSPPAPPLGLLDMVESRPVEYSTQVPAGATLLFYTDGLVEERHVDLGRRHDLLQRSLGEVDGHPERLVDQLLAAMGRTGEHTDDVAVLAVHRPAVVAPEVAAGAEAQLTVTDAPESVSTARHFLSGVLTEWGLTALRDTAALLVSETVTNALLHAHSAADVRVRRTPHGVEVEVRDHDDRLPAPREPDPDDESGRGLRLVEELSAAWGAEPSYAGKRVWFRLDLPDQ